MITSHRLPQLLLTLVLLLACLAPTGDARAAAARVEPALVERLAGAAPNEQLGMIVSYDSIPDQAQIQTLTAVGVSAVGFRHLPLAAVLATPAQIQAISTLPDVRGLYLNKPLQLYLNDSVETIGAPAAWDIGIDGSGVGVAVLDTGIDATHPDLQLGGTTAQNVKILGLQSAAGQDLNGLGLPSFLLEDQLNSDTTSGHGTHVAGIVAGSGEASNGLYRGVAPGAHLIGLGAGEGIEIFTALAGFDYVLHNRERYNIRVVNNSWGDITPGFDPQHPVNLATRTLYDNGISVVFASGNSGSNTDTLNTYSVAPWVIGVAAGEDDGQTLAFFSSRGIPGDDFYHPTLTAPGYLIVSARTPTGAVINASSTLLDPLFVDPRYIDRYTTASGTSMAAPHVAGAIALMLQANPDLTPELVKRVLVNTATPMPEYQEYAAGAGYLNASAAVTTALSIKNPRSYRDPRTGRFEQVYDLTSTWQGTLGAHLPGVATAVDTHLIKVPQGTVSLEVNIDWDLIANDLDLYLYAPDGSEAARSTTDQAIYQYANERVRVENPVQGSWTVVVQSKYNLNTPQNYQGTSNAVVLLHP